MLDNAACKWVSGIFAQGLLTAGALAQGTQSSVTNLSEVRVEGQRPIFTPYVDANKVYSATRVEGKALKLLGSPAQSNPWTALKMAPSVNFQSADGYGLGRPMSMRLRGKSSTHIGRTVEGLPIAGEPGFANGRGGGDLFDMENMRAVTLMRGAVPADQGLGFSNSGVVDMQLRGPEEIFGTQLSQSIGTDAFRRTFARMDTGTLPVPLRFFVSASDSHADKWRGPGEQKRRNFEAGMALGISTRMQVEVFAVHHDVRWHNYRSLNFDQVRSGADYKSVEYNRELTGNFRTDALYYGFNRQRHINNAALGKLTVNTVEGGTLLIKPYYWKENAWSLGGNANNGNITYWQVMHDTWGVDVRHEMQQNWGGWTVGYWHQSSEAPPPPTAQRLYRAQADGSLQFQGWSTLASSTRHRFDNPYVSTTIKTDDWLVSAGVRYMRYKDPSFTYYLNNSAPDVNYEDVFDYTPTPDPGKFSVGRTFDTWLPNLGLAWTASEHLTLSANYGRTYGRQNWGSVSGAFTNNTRKAFEASGITFNDLWNGLRPEQSTTLDLGTRWDFDMGYVAATWFHTRYRHKQLSLYDPDVIDPDTGLGVTYHRSIASATGKGVEIEMGLTPLPDMDVYLSYTWNRAYYTADAQTAGNRVVQVKGKQMQDSPRHMAKLNFVWQPYDWTVMAGLRYVGSRFGDTEEQEKVPDHTLVDVSLGYSLGKQAGLDELDMMLSVSNLFDKRYIGIISSSDYAVGGGTSYMPGAARSVVFNVSGRF